MRIRDVEPIVLRASSVDESRVDGTQDAFLVRVHTDEGIVGIGEADTSPYLARTMIDMPSSHALARGAREVLVGENPLEVDRIRHLLDRAAYHYGRGGVAVHVMSAIDMALWDIVGKVLGLPLRDLLGPGRLAAVRVYASEVMPTDPRDVQRIAEDARAAGYQALKLGWGPLGQDLDLDEQLIRMARETFGPERELMVDGGMNYTVKSALELLHRTSDVGLYWLEEPLAADDLNGYRRLSDATAVRIATGEAHSGMEPFRALVDQGHVDVLQPDLARCGGFTIARAIGTFAGQRRVEVVPHCFSSGVLVAASLHFAASLEHPTWSEYSVATSPFVSGILAEPLAFDGGFLTVPTGPGLGVALDDDVLRHFRVD